MASARLITQLVTWSLTLLTVRLLKPHDYGVVATAGLFTIFANLLLDGGLSLVLVSERELSLDLMGAACSWVFLIAVALSVLIALAAPVAAIFFNAPELTHVLQVASVQLPLGALLVVPQAILTRNMQFRQLALAQFASSIVQGGTTFLLAYRGFGYWALVSGILIGAALRALLQWAAVSDRPIPNLEFAHLRPILRKGSHLLGQRITYFFTSDFDTFAIGRIAGPTALGSYSLAKTLAHAALDQLSGVVNQVSVPVFAAKRDVGDQIAGLVQLTTLVSLLVFPMFWIVGVLSPVAFPIIFGNRWDRLILPFMAFSFVLPLRSIYTLLDSAIVGTGRVSTTFKNMLTWSAIMIPLLLVSARFGINAAACAWLVGFPAVFWLSMRRISCAFATPLRTFTRPLLVPMAIASVASLSAEAFQLIADGHLRPLTRLGVESVLAVTCYFALLRWTAPIQYRYVVATLLRFTKR